MGVSGSGAPRRGEAWRLSVRFVLAGGVLVGAWWLAEGLLGGSSAQAHDCVDRYGSGAYSYGSAPGANSGHGHFCGVRSTTPPTAPPTTVTPTTAAPVSDPESLSPIDRSGQHSAPHSYWHADHADRSHCGDGDHYYHDRYTRVQSCGGASSASDACVSGRHRHTYSGSWCHLDHTEANSDCRTHRDDGTHEANPCPDGGGDDGGGGDACVSGRHEHTYSGSWCHLDHTEANSDCRAHRDDGTHEANPCPDDDADADGDGGCSVALGALGAGTVTRSGTWTPGCTSDNRGSAQAPYRAVRYTFSVTGAATATVGVTSATDAYVFLTGADGGLSRHDDDSGAHSGDALLSAVSIAAGGYTVEATTAAPRQDGAFTMTLTLAGAPDPPPTAAISGLDDAAATPAAGAASAAVSDTFTVAPADATCTAAPPGATIAPATGASRTVTHTVAAGTTVTVTLTCTTGTSTAAGTARFTADAAPVPDVEIEGLDHASATPDTDATSAEVSDTFGVTPAAARCRAQATAGTPQVAPATGASRTVTLDVAAGTTVWVIVICNHHTNRDLAATRFTAHPAPTDTDTTTPPPTTPAPPVTAPACPSGGASGGATARSSTSGPPGSEGGSCPAPEPADRCSTQLSPPQPGTDSHTGSITNDTGCTSTLRSSRSRTYYARRHAFTLDAPAWVTVDLESDPAETPRLDTYLVLSGDSLDRPIRNDDARDTSHGRYYYDSRIGPRLLAAGTYTAEATTYSTAKTGNYTLTAEITATGLAESHTATVGAPETVTFRYWPPDAQVAVRAAANEELQPHIATTAHSGYGTATVTLTPRLVHDHNDITIRIQSNNDTRTRHIDIELAADCPTAPVLPGGPSLTLSPHNDVLCIRAGATDPAPAVVEYEVTPGTLNGIRASATAAAAAARADYPTCGITANRLAAFMLSIGFRDVQAGVCGAA